jgi:hypothetical protein
MVGFVPQDGGTGVMWWTAVMRIGERQLTSSEREG